MSRMLIRRTLVAALLIVVPSLSARVVHAVPRYSARYEQNCMLCHVNPTGGGMRSEYAVQELIPKELAMSSHRPSAMTAIDSHLNKAVRIGADFRQQYMAESKDGPQGGLQGFFPMQGDIHLSFQLDERYLLYLKHGMSNTYELWGLAHVLPHDGYVKVGRFVPPYGWHFDDHTMYVRSDLGFAPPANTDAGVEVGIAPKRGDLQVAVVNGNRGGTLDNDRRLAFAATGGLRFKLGSVATYVGASGYSQPGATADLGMAGLYGSLSAGPVTWVGEGDLVRRDPVSGPTVRSGVASNELSVLVRQGVEVVGTYDWYDPDRDHATGSRSRWGLGARLTPMPFLETQLLVRRTQVTAGSAVSGPSWDEAVVQFHLMY